MPSRRMRVRDRSSSVLQFRPAMNTSPAVGASSSPAMWSSDDLPAPEGPTRATISPGRTDRLTCLKMSSLIPPCAKALATSRSSRTVSIGGFIGSLVTQRFHRIELGGAAGGIERREEGQRQRHHGDEDGLVEIHLGRQLRQIIELG